MLRLSLPARLVPPLAAVKLTLGLVAFCATYASFAGRDPAFAYGYYALFAAVLVAHRRPRAGPRAAGLHSLRRARPTGARRAADRPPGLAVRPRPLGGDRPRGRPHRGAGRLFRHLRRPVGLLPLLGSASS